jgi:flagellar capping protein FliD
LDFVKRTTSSNSGRTGRAIIDTGATKLDAQNLISAQDAAVFYGKAGVAQPLLISSSKNELGGLIKGVNVTLHGVSDKPTTLSVARSSDNVKEEIGKFVENFNSLVDKMKQDTKYDTEAQQGGVLLGEVATALRMAGKLREPRLEPVETEDDYESPVTPA